ncbi:MAG: hypothetical protein H8E94_07080 [Alphaproteobacteria bacterium]|nr:hypothetical protein [Alphaproteobacteria bacterium]
MDETAGSECAPNMAQLSLVVVGNLLELAPGMRNTQEQAGHAKADQGATGNDKDNQKSCNDCQYPKFSDFPMRRHRTTPIIVPRLRAGFHIDHIRMTPDCKNRID